MELEEVRALVQAIESRNNASVELLPGVLQQVVDSRGEVVLDGTVTPIGVNVIAPCNEGDRVMVLFVPPRGGFVIGRHGGDPVGPGWNLLASDRGPADSVEIVLPDYATGWDDFELRVMGHALTSPDLVFFRVNGLGTGMTTVGATMAGIDGAGSTSALNFPNTNYFPLGTWGTATRCTSTATIAREVATLSVSVSGMRVSSTVADSQRQFGAGRIAMANAELQSIQLGSLNNRGTFTRWSLYGLNPS